MWGVIDESSDNPLAELWGLFKRDDDVSWQHRALCSQTDPEAFFPEKGGSTRDAKRVCAQCEVLAVAGVDRKRCGRLPQHRRLRR